jgi:hypothetical protein
VARKTFVVEVHVTVNEEDLPGRYNAADLADDLHDKIFDACRWALPFSPVLMHLRAKADHK